MKYESKMEHQSAANVPPSYSLEMFAQEKFLKIKVEDKNAMSSLQKRNLKIYSLGGFAIHMQQLRLSRTDCSGEKKKETLSFSIGRVKN